MSNNKTVWCISKYASPPHYGVGARLFYIAREFGSIGLDVLLISSDSNHLAKYPTSKEIYNFENCGTFEHMWIKTFKYSRSASLQRLISWIDFEYKLFRFDCLKYKQPDVVIVSSLSLLSIVYGIFLKKKYSCKLIFEIRDIHPLTLTEECGVWNWNPVVLFLGMLEKLGYNKADLIVGTMPNLKQHVKAVTGQDRAVFHSPLGIHELWYKERMESPVVNSLFPQEGSFVVGYAGSMGISNAMEPFIAAIKKMADEKGVYFVLVGDGDLKEHYIKSLSGYNNVTIGPKIKQNEIPCFLSKCDLLYLSTHDSKIWEYGQSLNKLIDYMMSGKPVIASYSGYPSMLNEANSGLFIRTGSVDSIVEAIKRFKDMDPDERALYGSRGKSWVAENHNYKNIARNYYDSIMALFSTNSQSAKHELLANTTNPR